MGAAARVALALASCGALPWASAGAVGLEPHVQCCETGSVVCLHQPGGGPVPSGGVPGATVSITLPRAPLGTPSVRAMRKARVPYHVHEQAQRRAAPPGAASGSQVTFIFRSLLKQQRRHCRRPTTHASASRRRSARCGSCASSALPLRHVRALVSIAGARHSRTTTCSPSSSRSRPPTSGATPCRTC